MDKQELLAVLDMSEDEQWKWCDKHTDIKYDPQIPGIESLADLAFRLRDEAVKRDWCTWQIASYHVWNATHESKYNPGKFGNRAKPIHWIIAALIAKQA